MRAKGLLTGRGIFEYYLKQAGKELSTSAKGVGLDVTTTCERIGSMHLSKNIPCSSTCPNTFMIYTILGECKSENADDLRNLWGAYLCSDLHGYAWSGSSVLVYSNELNSFGKCLFEKLVKKIGLEVEWTTDPLSSAR